MTDLQSVAQDTDHPRAVPAPQPSCAASAVTDRIMLLDRPKYLLEAPSYLNATHGGLVICDVAAAFHTIRLRKSGYIGVLLEDQAAYEKEVATAEEPFALPEPGLFGTDLDSVLRAQIDRGATAAVTPTRYVPAGASDALKAIMAAAQSLERDDVIILAPVSIAWLREESRAQFAAILRRIPHPVALILGGQYDPLQKFKSAPENLRALLREVPQLGLWRTDLAGFDALSQGGSFAAIGAGGSMRHLVPAGEQPESSKPFPHYPTVLVPQLLRFSAADFLANAYANSGPPRCHCSLCDGRRLDSFNGLTDMIRSAAHAHNAAAWNMLLPSLFQSQHLADRQLWWRKLCAAAVEAHLAENTRIKQPDKFKPPAALKKWANLPLSETTVTPNALLGSHQRIR